MTLTERNAKLDELLKQLTAAVTKTRTRLNNEKVFLESVLEGQGLAGTTEGSKAIDQVVVLGSVKDLLGITE